MSKVVALPQARIPLGYATVNGQKYPVEIDLEWNRALAALLDRTGGVSGNESFSEYVSMFFDETRSDQTTRDALRAVEDLTSQIESTRSELNSIKSMLDEHASQIDGLRSLADLRSRIESIEDRLA